MSKNLLCPLKAWQLFLLIRVSEPRVPGAILVRGDHLWRDEGEGACVGEGEGASEGE